MTQQYSAIAQAHSNIAFIKYWGNIDHSLRLPVNSSISMNLSELYTVTKVIWSEDYQADSLNINNQEYNDRALARVSTHLDIIRQRFNVKLYASVSSTNNFPMGTGIASSASSFAALTLAAVSALGHRLNSRELSILARRGSGSASRSIPSGYVEWYASDKDELSYAETFLDQDYWKLFDVVAIVTEGHKDVGSSAGHRTADTSILQNVRVQTATQRLKDIKSSLISRDFSQFADVVEEDSNLMHAVMLTSRPPLIYWEPISLQIMKLIKNLREKDGLQVCYTLDAGPNVHCICVEEDVPKVIRHLKSLSDNIDILVSAVGGGAHLINDDKV